MKKVLLTLIVSIAFCGSIFAQSQYESHWPGFYHPNFEEQRALVAAIVLDGQIVTAEDANWDALEIAFFVGDECRGTDNYLYNGYVEEYGDPFPILDGIPVFYNDPGEIVTVKMYDHLNEIEYNECNVTLFGEPFTILTGGHNMQGWEDPENPIMLNFNSSPFISATANPLEGGTITGAGNYEEGEVCSLSATASVGYTFLNWSENGIVVSTDAEYTFAVAGSRNLVANFLIDNNGHWPGFDYSFYANIEPFVAAIMIDGEIVTAEDANWSALEVAFFVGDECRGADNYLYNGYVEDYGDPFPIIDGAPVYYNNPNEVVSFRMYDHLNGVLYENCEPLYLGEPITIHTGEEHLEGWWDPEAPVFLNFTHQYNISASASPTGGGVITGAGTYFDGNICTLMATANLGYTFLNWTESGIVVSSNAEYVFTVTKSRNLVANFLVNNSSHWPGFYSPAYENQGVLVAAIVLDGEIVTAEDANWDFLEIAFFVGDECRGNNNYLYNGYVEYYGDPFPIIDGSPVYYNDPGETVTVKMYDHLNEIEYNECIVTYLGEPFTIITGDDNMQGWWDPETPVFLNFAHQYNISASASPIGGGVITGAGTYFNGNTCTLMATANSGYSFLNWSEDGTIVSSDASYSFIVESDRTLLAHFDELTSHWTTQGSFQHSMFMIGVVQIDGVEQASSTLELGAFCNGECRGSEFPVYDEGQWIYYMTIGGNTGDEITFRLYDHFVQQELNLYCFNVLPFEMYGLIGIDEPYEVQFASIYAISADVSPEDAGTIIGTGEYLLGTDVTMTATANEGYAFNNWTLDGEIVSTEPSYTFTVTSEMSFIANFDVLYSVSAMVSPDNAGTITGTGEYLYGTDVTLTATPNEGYAFNSWTLDGEVVSTEPSYTFTVTAPVSLMANFDVLYSVSISINMEEAGTVTGEGEYLYGTSVTVAATANEGYVFNSWTVDGEIVSTEPSYTFTVTSEMSFIANFDALYSVSATVNLENAGTIVGT